MLNISPIEENETKRKNITYTYLSLWFAFSFYFLVLKLGQDTSQEFPEEYLKSTIASLLFLIGYYKTKSYIIRSLSLLYILAMITVNGLSNPLSFSTDVFLIAPMITTGFIVLKNKHALLYSILCIFSFFCCVFAAKNFFPEVDSFIVNMNLELSLFIFLSFITTTILLFMYARFDNSNIKRMEKFVELLRKYNLDNEMLVKVISHDINNALNRSTLLLSKLKAKRTSDDQTFESLESSIFSIKETIENLKHSRGVEFQDDKASLSEVRLSSIFKKTELIFSDHLLDKDILLETNISEESLKVRTEPVALVHQVLSNLIGNAIKFSKPNTKVVLSAEKTGDSRVIINIENTADSHHLLNLTQTPNSKSCSFPGTNNELGQGLGLNLVDYYTQTLGIEKGLNITKIDNDEIRLKYSLNLEGV